MNNKYFETTNFYLATFLLAKGNELINIDKSEKRYKFIFANSIEIEKLVKNFNFAPNNFRGILVDARKFVIAIKSLKDKIYQD